MSEDFYSRVQRRIWTDARFRKLSRPAPNARDLFLYLLTTPAATQIPGLVALGESAMAEDLEWPVAGLRKSLVELEQAGMVKVDRVARLLWLPNAIKHNPPRSSDNVKGWAKFWRMLPECDLLAEAARTMMDAFLVRGGAFPAAFARVSGLTIPQGQRDAEDGGEVGAEDEAKGQPMVGGEVPPPPGHQQQQQQQDQKQQISHTLAGARAHEAKDEGQTESPIVTAGTLLGDVERHEMLATLHGDRTWAMRALGGLQAAACRAEDASAAIDAFVVDNAGKAPEDGPALDDFVRENIGRYLKNAKQHGDRARQRAARDSERGSSSASTTPDQQVVLAVFAEVWSAKKKQPFVQAQGDEKHAAFIVDRAWEEAGKLKMRPRDLVRFWAEKHLGCSDRWVVESDHALRTMGSQLTSYGLPPTKKALSPRPSPPDPEGPIVAPSAEIVAKLTGRPIPPPAGGAS